MPDYKYRTILVEKANKLATVTLNRPDRLNAVGDGMHDELEDLWGRINADPDINAIVLTGAGRAFCAGGDISEMADGSGGVGGGPGPAPTFSRGPRRMIVNMLEVEAPIIVAVNGDAVGFGATLALFGDIIVAADSARIGDTHVRVGLVAGDGGSVIWPLLVGVHRAKEHLMMGDLINGVEAERIGLVNYSVPKDEVMSKALELAQKLADGPTWAIRWTKASINKVIREQMNLILDTSLAFEALSSGTEDMREAARAFMEKRKPEFSGR
jgi:enoyl-CoA hydratase